MVRLDAGTVFALPPLTLFAEVPPPCRCSDLWFLGCPARPPLTRRPMFAVVVSPPRRRGRFRPPRVEMKPTSVRVKSPLAHQRRAGGASATHPHVQRFSDSSSLSLLASLAASLFVLPPLFPLSPFDSPPSCSVSTRACTP
jgi:hypothetical protein